MTRIGAEAVAPADDVRASRAAHRWLAFLGTRPLHDVVLLVALLPLWWALGVEQWIGPVVLAWAALKLAVARGSLTRTPVVTWLALVVLGMLGSGAFIVEPERIVTFARNLSVHLAALLVVVVVVTDTRSWNDVRWLLRAVLFAMTSAAIIGALAFLRIAQLEFPSPFGQLLPGWIRATDYGAAIATRSVGSESWFSGLGRYVRVDSMFLFSTMYAAALAATVPVAAFATERARGAARIAAGFVTVLLLANLVYSTGRVATIALVAGAAYFALLRMSTVSRVLLAFTIGVAAIATIVLAPIDTATEAAESVVLARGAGSLNSRMLIYRETLAGVVERPVLGWGTERDIDVEGFKYPAGSHSFYLGTLYRHGVLGLVFLVGALVATWRATRVPASASDLPPDAPRLFLTYARWTFVTVLIYGLTTVPDVDGFLYLIVWTVLAAAIATRRLIDAPEASPTSVRPA